MKLTHSISLAAAASLFPLFQVSQALPTDTLAGSFKVNFNVKRGENLPSVVAGSRAHAKRANQDGAVEMTLKNQEIIYVAELAIGSNGDKVEVHVDTGSSDLWSPPLGDSSDNSTSSSSSADAADGGDSNDSGSKTCTGVPYQTYAFGTWGYDTVKIGNVSVSDVAFAIANLTSNDIGVLGIGLPEIESVASYENLPYKMKTDGVIKKVLYSLYLDQKDASTGSVLFGAIDHAKYEGKLETLPVSKNAKGKYADLIVDIQGLSVTDEGETRAVSENASRALLDSGTPLSRLLPEEFVELGDKLNGEFDEKETAFRVDCELSKSNATFDIRFGESTLRVPVSSNQQLSLPMVLSSRRTGDSNTSTGAAGSNGSSPSAVGQVNGGLSMYNFSWLSVIVTLAIQFSLL
ncbi:hypothetical protein KGF57_004156 [Candida theae]|uniref:candidapepsin n=1 Tax=Candida theae TaxID=1198502 RepID=A0AAD5BCU6_9ASCO|nr:uncharacterized protein KGF57_004156 [Candida theae]KAI5952192.1 hypothetical protein KGF57_004156 [Candida theae]